MLFNSLEFIFFFPVVTLSYFLIPHRYRWIQLLIASCFFYIAAIPSYILILFALILIDYFAAIKIENSANKKFWLTLSIISNIIMLCFFKYFNFFIVNINSISGSHFNLLYLALPIGLSFHTFQSISYTVEVYRGNQKAVTHLGYYALYIMFYPQLVAGPIERPYKMFPQFFEKHSFSSQNLYEGLRLMTWGFFKKIVIADRLGTYVDPIFNSPKTSSFEEIWLSILFFSIQIYADFSGYSDIATGAARCMGFNLTINFNRPYFVKNIRDFWKRWHISLSTWFKDYVYIPLGGNKKGKKVKYLNTILTFTLSGLWHGAGWNFIAWGILHGVYMIVSDFFSFPVRKTSITSIIRISITGAAIGFAWVFFRANSITEAIGILIQCVRPGPISFRNFDLLSSLSFFDDRILNLFFLASILFMFIVEKKTNPLLTNLNKNIFLDIFIFTSTILAIIFLGIFIKSSFIYYQF